MSRGGSCCDFPRVEFIMQHHAEHARRKCRDFPSSFSVCLFLSFSREKFIPPELLSLDRRAEFVPCRPRDLMFFLLFNILDLYVLLDDLYSIVNVPACSSL
jgi:hypothetical protein